MKSRITIEVDFENGNEPVIQILSQNSDDVRDKLISSFLQNLYHTSRWCRIEYKGELGATIAAKNATIEHFHKWAVIPIKPNELLEEIKLMEAVVSQNFGRVEEKQLLCP